jgi:MoxR-like ATPase
MPTPGDFQTRRSIVFDPAFHDVDELLQRVSPEILPWRELNDIGAAIQRSVTATETLERYVLDLWEATRAPHKVGVTLDGVDMENLILAGASPRGMMSLTRAARVVAWLDGRTHLVPDDVRSIAPVVLGHRIFFTPVYELRRAQIADALIEGILSKVPTPRVS